GVPPGPRLARAGERRTPRQLEGRTGSIALRVHQRPEPEALEPLGDRAPVPAEGARGRLHVEAVLAEGSEHRFIAPRVLASRLPGGKPQVGYRDGCAVRKRKRLAQTVLQLARVARPVVALERCQRGLGEREGRPSDLGGGVTDEASRK